MKLENILKDIGLNSKESKIYLSLVELGSAPVSKVAEQAKINRVTAYSILEKLIERGMANSVTKNKIRIFSATNPKVISHELKRKASNFQKALPAFRRLGGEINLPHVKYYEGLEGIKSIYAKTLESKTEILNYANSKEIRAAWPEYDEQYVEERVKRKIMLRGIAPLDKYGKEVQAKDKENHREIRLVSAKKFTFTNEINIWDDKVAIISFKDQPAIGVIIESMEIANTQRDIFKMAWEYAKVTNNW